MKKSEIKLTGLQIKSLEKAQKLASSLNTIEEECGIKHVKITLEDCFVCEWIDLSKLNKTPMEDLLRGLIE